MTSKGEIAEFVYQAICLGTDKRILEVMDLSDVGFYDALNDAGFLDIHDSLADLVNDLRGLQ